MNFQIKTYTASQLQEYINSDDFKNLENYPITPHRALSHINNPRVDKEDKLLYIAFENKKVVGYRLIMADKIVIDHHEEKVGWYSCVWVHPQKRGSGIAKKLVELSLKDWNNQIIFQGPVKESKNLYTKTNIFNETFLNGLRAYSRFDFHYVFTTKFPQLNPFSFLLKRIDICFNILVDGFSSKYLMPENIELINSIDSETENFLHKHQTNSLFKRSKTELDWIINFPWIIESNEIDNISANYYFSSIAKKYQLLYAKFYSPEKKVEAFVIFQIRDNHLSIHHAYFDISQIKNIIAFTYYLIQKEKLNFFSVYDEKLIEYIKSNKNPFIFKKNLQRGFYYSKNFDHYFKKNPRLSFEAGDGDMIFT
ncbi:MAG: GNAT family N-acetyltransferase [Flavobacteriales bacterium]|nr:GNAT family N-acetyltransferase [Flavobacteriales bacterium]